MAYGLGSRRSNRLALGLYAVVAVIWSGWRIFDYARSEYVEVSVEPMSDTPAVQLFGGVLRPGNVVELSVPKVDVARLGTMIDVLRYFEIVAGLAIILVGMVFVYRFCDRVVDGRAFARGATVDVVALAVCILLYPAVTGFTEMLGTNAVVGALSMADVIDTERDITGVWIAAGICVLLQFVYAALQQGTKLAEDADGLV